MTADEGHASRIRAQIDQWARDLGIDAALVRTASARRGASEFRGRRERYVVDHFVHDPDNIRDASTREALAVIACR